MKRKVSEFDYGKGEFGGGGVDVRGAGGGGGKPTPAQARAAAARPAVSLKQASREVAGKSTRKLLDDLSQQTQPTDELERQRYLKGEGGPHFSKGGKVKGRYSK